MDLEIATFTYTQDRDTRIDFSIPYYKATGRLLVPNNSSINSAADLAGKTVTTTRGSIYDKWVTKCFPNTKLLVTDTVTNSQLASPAGPRRHVHVRRHRRARHRGHRPQLKLTNDGFLQQPYGIGIKQDNVAMKKWVDSRLNVMRQKDLFNTILKNNVPARVFASFQKNILRPKQTFQYNAVDPIDGVPVAGIDSIAGAAARGAAAPSFRAHAARLRLVVSSRDNWERAPSTARNGRSRSRRSPSSARSSSASSAAPRAPTGFPRSASSRRSTSR